MTLKKTGNIDLGPVLKQLEYLKSHEVVIGFWAGENSMLLEIVRANEYGAHIVPKHQDYLWIPSKYAIKAYGKSVRPKDVKGLFVPHKKRVAYVKKTNKKGDDELLPYFYLVKKVNIPARPFIRKAFLDNQKKYRRYVKAGIDHILLDQEKGEDLLKTLGKLGQHDVRESIRRWTKPGNAPVTIENKKGSNNPLVDTGMLPKKVTWKIIPVGDEK